jgi:hypothetical protein
MFGLRSKKSPQKGNRRNSARLFHRKPSFECLEGREMLSAGNLFAEFVGILNQPGDVEHIAVSIAPEKLGITGDKAFLGFQTQSRGGGSFDPAALQIRRADGTLVKPEFSVANLPGSTDSVVLVQLGKGNYTLDVSGTLGARSQFQVDVYLVGDVNGDHAVRADDLDLIRQSYGSKSGGAAYSLAADANLDGRINAMDLSLARRNQASSQPVVSGNQLLSLSVVPNGDMATTALASEETAPSWGGIYDRVAAVTPAAGYEVDAPMQFFESTKGWVQPLTSMSAAQGGVFSISGSPGDIATVIVDWSSREAGYGNDLVAYQVDDLNGTIGGIAPGQSGYSSAAAGRALGTLDAEDCASKTNPDKQNTLPDPHVMTFEFEGGDYFAFYLVQGTYKDTQGQYYHWFPFSAANVDGYQHFQDSSGSYSFEDLSNNTGSYPNPGGFTNDADFNDVVFTVTTWAMDIDTDSNNDGSIETSGMEDGIETDDPGKRIFVNNDDDNMNGVKDASDAHSAYTDAGKNDKDFAEIKLSYDGLNPANMSGYKLQLNWNNDNLHLYASKDKEALAQTEWTLGSAITLPNSIYAEGITEGAQTVSWRLVKTSTSGIVASDTIKINVEKIVWPSNETGSGWQGDPTTEWNGFELADTWFIEKSLCEIINGNVGSIHTPYPKETAEDVWEGDNTRGDATLDLIEHLGVTSGDPFHIEIEVSYQFDGSMPHSMNNYVDASNGQIKPGFFANSGVYIDNKCEIQIYDTDSLLDAMDNGRNVIIDGDQVSVTGEMCDESGDYDPYGNYVHLVTSASGTKPVEAVNSLITGIAYGQGNYDDYGYDDPNEWLNAAPMGSGSLTIDVERRTDGKYDITIGDYSYTALAGTGSGVGRTADDKIHLQAHWGSGVIFTAVTVTTVS